MSRIEKSVLENLLEGINEEISSYEDTFPDFKEEIENAKDNKFDTYDEYTTHGNFMLQEIKKEVQFKRKARKYSLIVLAVFSLLMFLNVFVMIYFNGRWIFPRFDSKIVLAMITATFANVFAIITLVFKYIFSSTTELMNHAKDMNRLD